MEPDSRKHVLCVDDDCDVCELLTFALPQVDFTFAHTFATGLEFIRRGIFDLYVLDSWLPDGSGVDLCREIRRTDPNSPVIFLSAAAYATDHQAAMEAGATAYLDKPMGLLQLADKIASLTREAELRSLEAKTAELEAIRDNIGEQLSEAEINAGAIAERLTRANEHLLRARTFSIFMNHGGVRAHFERFWPTVLKQAESGSDLETS